MNIQIKFSKAEFRKLLKDLAKQLEKTDASLRRRYHGKSVSTAKPAVKRELGKLGIELPPKKLTEYTESIVEGKDFEFILG